MIFDFSKIQKFKAEDIINLVPEEDLYSYYLDHPIQINKLYKCCFHEDKSPSLGIYNSSRASYMRYKCFGCGAQGNIFGLVSDLYNISYYDAIDKIVTDFNLIERATVSKPNFDLKNHINKNINYTEVPRTQVYPTFRNWKKIDYDYWNQYHIPLLLLIEYEVNPCSVVYYRTKNGNYRLFASETSSDPIYHFNVDGSHKVYRPLHTKKAGKWMQNCTAWDIQGLKQIPQYNDILFITSSLKDCMVLKIMGYAAIAPHGEGQLIPDKILDYLFATNKDIILFYDNDEAGIKYSKKFSEDYNIPYILLPNKETKDISDFVKIHGIEEGKKIIQGLIANIR